MLHNLLADELVVAVREMWGCRRLMNIAGIIERAFKGAYVVQISFRGYGRKCHVQLSNQRSHTCMAGWMATLLIGHRIPTARNEDIYSTREEWDDFEEKNDEAITINQVLWRLGILKSFTAVLLCYFRHCRYAVLQKHPASIFSSW